LPATELASRPGSGGTGADPTTGASQTSLATKAWPAQICGLDPYRIASAFAPGEVPVLARPTGSSRRIGPTALGEIDVTILGLIPARRHGWGT
jgi:hypothetical protein